MKPVKSLKTVMAVSLATLMVATVTACGGKADDKNAGAASGGAAPAQEKKKDVTLDFVWFTDGVEGDVMKGLIKEYQEKNTNVKINLIEVPYKDLSSKVKTMISGGQPPALARMTDTGAFAKQAVDLSQYVGGADAYTAQFVDSIKPYYVSADKKVYAAPMDLTANGLIYNKTLFNKAGVKVPTGPDDVWTWDEFSASLKQVMEKGGAKYGLVWDYTPHRWSTMLYEFGGSMISEDGKKAAINSPEGVQTLDYFSKLHKDGIIPTSVWLGSENPNNLFRTGTVAAHLAGNWMMSNYKDINNFEWGVTYLPKQKIRSSVPGGKYLMAFQGSKVEKEAAEFIKWATSKEINAKYNSQSLFLSPRKDSAKLDWSYGKEMFEVFSNELANTTPLAANDWARQTVVPKFQNELKDNISKTLGGKMSSKEALDATAKLIDKAIADESK